MKLSDYENEDAIDLLADIIEPVTTVLSDKNVVEAMKNDTQLEAIKIALKSHKTEIIQIMARLDNTPVEEYKCSFLTLPIKLLEIISDKDLQSFFKSQLQSLDMNAFGSVTVNTEETEAE